MIRDAFLEPGIFFLCVATGLLFGTWQRSL